MIVAAKNGAALHRLSVILPKKEIISNSKVQIARDLLLGWHSTYLGDEPTGIVEKTKEQVASPWPLMPRKREKGRNNPNLQA